MRWPVPAIKESRQRGGKFRALVEYAPDAMLIVNPDGRMELVNRQTETMFGYQRQELIGQKVELLMPQRFRESHLGQRSQYSAKPHVRNMGAGLQLYGLRKDGTEFPVDISLSPHQSKEGPVVFVAIRDVSERKAAEEIIKQEKEAAEQLRELDRLKDDFLSTVSHELRTPLTSITGLAEILREPAELDDETKSKANETIYDNAVNMTQMIEQLLDFSRLQAGRVALKPKPLLLREAVDRCIKAVDGATGSRSLVLDIPAIIKVVADPNGVERILVNLLTNASKFSPENSSIQVAARVEGAEVIISVKDEGIGIPTQEQGQVFERFYQSATASGKRGTGIGLSVVRSYVELQGGSVWVESMPGQGSTFFFTLPLALEKESQ